MAFLYRQRCFPWYCCTDHLRNVQYHFLDSTLGEEGEKTGVGVLVNGSKGDLVGCTVKDVKPFNIYSRVSEPMSLF